MLNKYRGLMIGFVGFLMFFVSTYSVIFLDDPSWESPLILIAIIGWIVAAVGGIYHFGDHFSYTAMKKEKERLKAKQPWE